MTATRLQRQACVRERRQVPPIVMLLDTKLLLDADTNPQFMEVVD